MSFKSLKIATVEYPFHCCLIHAERSDTGKVGTQPPVPQHTAPTSKICTKNPGGTGTATSPPPTTTAAPQRDMSKGSLANDTIPGVLTLPPNDCVDINTDVVITDPPVTNGKTVDCKPEEDAFNPCGNLLGSDALRVCSWVVLIFALLGNSLKLFVLIMSKRKISIAKILMCNLAFANLCMGVFLCMLASADLYSLGEYQNFAIRWQYRAGCRVAGFVSIFSTELAVFVLTVITVERYFTIVHPLKLDKHLNTKQIIVLMGLGWVFSFTMALLPILPYGVSSYQKVAICLPFEVQSTGSKAYVTFLLATNGMAFFFVLFCYGRMYCSLGGSGSGENGIRRVEGRVAKRMAMLVITNFACWFPIALVSLIAIYGTALIGVPAAKFFLVFVYPINSFTNPYLYAIGTKHFQLDALEIIGRLGLCRSTIKSLSNRLRDELETLPNSSRAYTGSKVSLSSLRTPNQTPMVLPRENHNFSAYCGNSCKTNNGRIRSNNNRDTAGSPRNSSACSPCSFLSIPLIHRRNYDLKQQRGESDSGLSFSLENDSADNARSSLKFSDQSEKILAARRTSAREVVLEGNVFSWHKRRSHGSLVNDYDENVPIELNNEVFVERSKKDQNLEQKDSPKLRVPTLLVTTC